MAKTKNATQLGQINNIVVVMLENRSFDHMLGYLYSDRKNISPSGQPFEGLTGSETNPDGKPKQGQGGKCHGKDGKGKPKKKGKPGEDAQKNAQ